MFNDYMSITRVRERTDRFWLKMLEFKVQTILYTQ